MTEAQLHETFEDFIFVVKRFSHKELSFILDEEKLSSFIFKSLGIDNANFAKLCQSFLLKSKQKF